MVSSSVGRALAMKAGDPGSSPGLLLSESPHAPLIRPVAIGHGSDQSSEDGGGIQDALGRNPLVVNRGIASLWRKILLVWHRRHSSEKVTTN